MSILADRTIKNTKSQSEEYSLKDGWGLFFIVKPNGSRYWYFRFNWGRKKQHIFFGTYPEIGLKDAHRLHHPHEV